MRPDTAVRLVFGAASAVGKLARTQPDTVGTSLQHVAAVIETATGRVSTGTSEDTWYILLLCMCVVPLLLLCKVS